MLISFALTLYLFLEAISSVPTGCRPNMCCPLPIPTPRLVSEGVVDQFLLQVCASFKIKYHGFSMSF